METAIGKEFRATVRVALESDAKTVRLCIVQAVTAGVAAVLVSCGMTS